MKESNIERIHKAIANSLTAKQIADTLHVNLKVRDTHGELEELGCNLNEIENVLDDARNDTTVRSVAAWSLCKLTPDDVNVRPIVWLSSVRRVIDYHKSKSTNQTIRRTHLHGECLSTGCLSVGEDGSVVTLENICAGQPIRL